MHNAKHVYPASVVLRTYGEVEVYLNLVLTAVTTKSSFQFSAITGRHVPIIPKVFGTRLREVVSFTFQPLYLREMARSRHWIRGWVGPELVLVSSALGN
jgi:hypothetical protein